MSNPQVELHIKNYGVITLELDAEKAPKSAENFVSYVKKGHYDNTVFHRVIPGFMVQGGGFEPGMTQKPTRRRDPERGQQRPEERQLHRRHGPHQRAPLGHRAVLHQRVDNGFLNHTAPSAQGWGYAVFGKVIKGADVVDKIKAVKTGRKGFHDDVPLEDVVIEKAVVIAE
jgi:peptidyl-prolyl cis-trans isomerase B (cyclophilin B)